jgi:hypothetical protein
LLRLLLLLLPHRSPSGSKDFPKPRRLTRVTRVTQVTRPTLFPTPTMTSNSTCSTANPSFF